MGTNSWLFEFNTHLMFLCHKSQALLPLQETLTTTRCLRPAGVSDSDLTGSDATSHYRRKGVQRVAFQIDALLAPAGRKPF